MSADEIPYIGNELDLFSHAKNWKSYFARNIQPHIRGDVAEVGAGLGGTTATLCTGKEASWVCLEPDPDLCGEIQQKCKSGVLPDNVEPHVATLESFDQNRLFDSILYIDVLEHIEQDQDEANRAAGRLREDGKLIVLAPAHQSLFTPFDASIGHYRRYDRSSLTALAPAGLELEACYYLDSIGLCASLANKLFLHQSTPKISQIKFWDNFMVPMSRLTDAVSARRLGKTVIAIWRKPRS